MYYFNLGATLTNANTKNDPKMRKAAVEAFDKAIAADPTRADAYYWKGTNLIGAATLQGDKMMAPPGTAEAFQKYLELGAHWAACGRSQGHAGQRRIHGRDQLRNSRRNPRSKAGSVCNPKRAA